MYVLAGVRCARPNPSDLPPPAPPVPHSLQSVGVIAGPQLNVSLSHGNCSLLTSLSTTSHNVTATCFSPTITYSSTPITFTPPHHEPDTYTPGTCVFGKTAAGKAPVAEEHVLYSQGPLLHYASLAEFMSALETSAFEAWGMVPGGAQADGPAVVEPNLLELLQQQRAHSLQSLAKGSGWQVVSSMK